MAKYKLWYALGLVVLLAGAYCFGRRDAPNSADAQTASLLAGIKSYKARSDSLTRQIVAVRKDLAASTQREKALAAKRTVTPVIVPASCAPWADNLSTCDQQRGELQGQVEATGRLLALAETARAGDTARVDSLTKALRKARAGDYVLGVKLPSRTTSLGVGAITGFILGLVVHR